MNRILLTYAVAHASGMDAGNRSMRAAGRTKWNEDDYDAACVENNRLFDLIDIPATERVA